MRTDKCVKRYTRTVGANGDDDDDNKNNNDDDDDDYYDDDADNDDGVVTKENARIKMDNKQRK